MPGLTERSMAKLGRALTRLREAADQPETAPLAVDGTIQRFEFVFELYWKTLKRMLQDEGTQAVTPREVIGAAFVAGWLDDEQAWLRLLQARNETSHTYDEERALAVYETVRAALPMLEATYGRLAGRLRSR